MGTVLSISPATKKAMDAEIAGDASKGDRSLKRHSMFVSLSWKKLVASSAKKSAKKVTPNPPGLAVPRELPPGAPAPREPPPAGAAQVAHLNSENARKSHQAEERRSRAPIPVPVPTVPAAPGGRVASVQKQASSVSLAAAAAAAAAATAGGAASPRRIVIQASTGELLRCLGDFVCRRCRGVKELNSGEVILWFRNIDRTLLLQGWQDQGFITPANVVFVYLLCADTIPEAPGSPAELQGTFQTCLYLAYSYMGNEISYPLKPFMTEANKDAFWDTSLGIIERLSAKMLRLNADPHFFTEVFQDLKNQRDSCGESNLDR